MRRILIPLLVSGFLLPPIFGQTVKAFNVQQFHGGGYLGVQLRDVTAEDVASLKLAEERGAVIEEVLPDTPAEDAGLQAEDVVLTYANQPIQSVAQLRRLVSETPSGRTAEILVSRDGSTLTRQVTIGKREGPLAYALPNMDALKDLDAVIPRMEIGPGDHNVFVWRGRPRLGIRGESLNEQMADFLRVPEKKGVLVMEVLGKTPASVAGLRAGDVIVACDGEAVADLAELSRHLDEGTHEITVVRKQERLTLNTVIESHPKESTGSSIKM